MSHSKRALATLITAVAVGVSAPGAAIAGGVCPPEPCKTKKDCPKPPKKEKKKKCNAGRGNGSELVNGVDCDPGNSGGHNKGGD